MRPVRPTPDRAGIRQPHLHAFARLAPGHLGTTVPQFLQLLPDHLRDRLTEFSGGPAFPTAVQHEIPGLQLAETRQRHARHHRGGVVGRAETDADQAPAIADLECLFLSQPSNLWLYSKPRWSGLSGLAAIDPPSLTSSSSSNSRYRPFSFPMRVVIRRQALAKLDGGLADLLRGGDDLHRIADGTRSLARGIRFVRQREADAHRVTAGSELRHRQPGRHRAPFPGTDARMQIPTLPGGRRGHAPGYHGAAILLLEPLAVDLQEELVNRRPVVGQDALRLALQVGLEKQRPAPVVPLRLRRVQPDLHVPARLARGSVGRVPGAAPGTSSCFSSAGHPVCFAKSRKNPGGIWKCFAGRSPWMSKQ